MKIEIHNLNNLSKDKPKLILLRMLSVRYVNLTWVKDALADANIKGRSRHYKAFMDPVYFNRDLPDNRFLNLAERWSMTPEQQEARLKAVSEILDQTSLDWWIQRIAYHVTLTQLAQIVAPYLEPQQLNVSITLEGINAN